MLSNNSRNNQNGSLIRKPSRDDDVDIAPPSSYHDRLNIRRRSSVTQRTTSLPGDVTVTYQRSRSNPVISEKSTSRLERRRSAVTFPSTYRSLNASSHCNLSNSCQTSKRMVSTSSVVSGNEGYCCVPQRKSISSRHTKQEDWSTLVQCLTHKEEGRRVSPTEIRIRKSLEKAIQKAGYNMNELVSATTAGFSPITQRRCIQNTELDWSENSLPDDHLWAPSNASGDLCYVGEQNCTKSGPRKKCSACHIIVHDSCYSQLVRIGFQCKTTFREVTSRNMREGMVVHHHWVHRRKQEGKCKHCGKSFEKRFGFREPTKIVAISCSWCKDTFHNKVGCFQMHKINEPCSLGDFAKCMVPPTWIIKTSQKQKSVRNRSKKKRNNGSTWRKRSSRDQKQKTFNVKPISHQAPFSTPILVFINPKSGGNQGSKLMQAFQWAINPRQIFDLSKGGPQEGLELYRKVPNLRILACGGDGTVGWILSVIDKMNLSRPPPVAILPLGTGNDLSRTLNFGAGYTDEPIHKILHGVEDARLAKLDRWKLHVKKNEQALVQLRHEDHDDNCVSIEEPEPTGVDKPPLDVVNNYFSVGSDAQVSLSFHESREAHPSKFNSRIGNKMYYVRRGVQEYISRQSKDLSKHITIVCDGQNITPKLRDLKPACILFLNIPRYSSGTSPWGHPTGNEFAAQRHDDKLIEVLAFSPNQLGMLFVGGHGERLCQCRSAYIRTYKAFPVQIDGEPCRLNPSDIKLEFLNQANVLHKSKRRPSVTEVLSQEQIKVRLNMISNHEFDQQLGSKSKLIPKATPLLVTVAMSNSTLDVLRSCLDGMNTNDKSSEPNTDRWFFLDSSDDEKLYRIDRNQENLHHVCDVITGERELYVLEVQDPQTPPLLQHFPVRSRNVDRKSIQFRGRIQSDSGITALSEPVDLTAVAQSIGSSSSSSRSSDDYTHRRGSSGNASPRVLASQTSVSPLDVVFEYDDNENDFQTKETPTASGESPETEIEPFEGILEASASQTVNDVTTVAHSDGVSEKTDETPTDGNNNDKSEPSTSESNSLSPLNRVRGGTNESTASSYSSSSNEYVITDDVLPRARQASLMTQRSPNKPPLRAAQSIPPTPHGQLLGDYLSKLDQANERTPNKKKHRRSNTDTDPKKALSGGQMLLSSFVKNMKLSGNNSNNNNNNNNNYNNNHTGEDCFKSCLSCDNVSAPEPRHNTHYAFPRRHSTGDNVLPYNGGLTLIGDKCETVDWNKIFLDAASRGDADVARRALGSGASFLATDESGCNALHLASSSAHLGIVNELLERMPGLIHLTDNSRQSALHLAAQKGALDVCVALVAAGAKVGLVDHKGQSVLDQAKRNDDPLLVEYLLSIQSQQLKAIMLNSPETDL